MKANNCVESYMTNLWTFQFPKQRSMKSCWYSNIKRRAENYLHQPPWSDCTQHSEVNPPRAVYLAGNLSWKFNLLTIISNWWRLMNRIRLVNSLILKLYLWILLRFTIFLLTRNGMNEVYQILYIYSLNIIKKGLH